MKSMFKVIILLMIAFVFLVGCGAPVDWESDKSDTEKQESTDQLKFDEIGINAYKIVNSNETGTYNGQFYTFWKDVKNTGTVEMILNDFKVYTSSTYNVTGGSVVGLGWSNESANATRIIHYNGSYNSSYGGAFGVYGWTRSPLVEYYVCEKTGVVQGPHNSDEEKNGNDHIWVGTVTTDGSTYDIYKHYRQGFPSIEGDSTNFWQYISVRQTPQTVGTITMANHISAWSSYGLTLGSHTSSNCYQILFTEIWSKQDVNGVPITGNYVTGRSLARICDYHEVPVRIKAYDNSGWLARADFTDILYKANTTANNVDFNLCYTSYSSSSGSGSGNLALRGPNLKYVGINANNRGYSNITSVGSAALFSLQSGTSGKKYLKYTTNNKYLAANGSLFTNSSDAQLRFEYTSTNRD